MIKNDIFHTAAAAPDVRVVSSSGLKYREDGVHYTSAAALHLGVRFFRVFNQ